VKLEQTTAVGVLRVSQIPFNFQAGCGTT